MKTAHTIQKYGFHFIVGDNFATNKADVLRYYPDDRVMLRSKDLYKRDDHTFSIRDRHHAIRQRIKDK